jgi:hypothetical protein
MADYELDLSFFSRFKETTLLQSGGRVFFGRWRPITIRLDGGEKVVQVTERDNGTLDLISYREYGTRELAWAIASANGINRVPEEVIPGLFVRIPKLSNIEDALQKTINEQ